MISAPAASVCSVAALMAAGVGGAPAARLVAGLLAAGSGESNTPSLESESLPLPFSAPADRINTHATPTVIELSWSDAEERLQGSVRPATPLAGQELRVAVSIGSFEGKSHEGPVTLALKNADQHYGETHTVEKKDKDVSWVASFVPPEDGDYTLDVSWHSTHVKVVHATIQVTAAPLPRWPWLVVAGVLIVALIAYGVRSAVRSGG